MADAFMHGFGGGSNSGEKLNFQVMAYSEEALLPEVPEENTIAVITGTGITGYRFSPEKPEEPYEGMAWIETGTRSTGPFSATGDSSILLYPLTVKQYENGQWTEKTAKIFLGGVWTLWWNGQLYSPGIEWEEMTGGWSSAAARASSVSGESAAAPVITRKDDRILADGSGGGGILYCSKKIDLTEYSLLTFEGIFTRAGSLARNILAACWSELGSYYTETVAEKGLGESSGTILQVDISDLEGEYYVGMGLTASTAEITRCYLQ